MGESSEINVYHNKDIIDRLERLECWWKFLPDPAMYTDIIRMYEEIKGFLSRYLMKDEDDTVSAITTFQKMPKIPDATGEDEDIIKINFLKLYLQNYAHLHQPQTITAIYTFQRMPVIPDTRERYEEDIVKEKYLNSTLLNYIKNNEDQTLNNNFTFNGTALFNGTIFYHNPTDDNEPAIYSQIKQLETDKLTKTYTDVLQEVSPKVEFKRQVTFSNVAIFKQPIENVRFTGRIPDYYDGATASDLLTNKTWEEKRYRFIEQYPYIDENLTNPPGRDVELVTKKYVDDQIREHVLPDDVAFTTKNNAFTGNNTFSGQSTFYNQIFLRDRLVVVSNLGTAGEICQHGTYSEPDQYYFTNPRTYHNSTEGYSTYINHHYYNQHTLLKDSDKRQNVTSVTNFENILVKGQEIETLTPAQARALSILENMLFYENQLRFNNDTILVNTFAKRNLEESFETNFSFSSPYLYSDYSNGITSSVLGGFHRFDKDYQPYELIGVLEEVKDDTSNNKYQDIIHLLTYSKENKNDFPPMVNLNVGMWVSGIKCVSEWNDVSECLKSLHTILGYNKPEQDLDDSLDIQPVFSKITCEPTQTSYKSGLLYGKGYFWNNRTLNKDIEVTKYALYSEGITTLPEKSLSNSDFNAIFGYLDWSSPDKLIRYEASSFRLNERDVNLNPNLQNFYITSNNGSIKWESSSYTNTSYEKEISLNGSHSKNEYDFSHNFYSDQKTNRTQLKIYKSLNEYNLYTLQRLNHRAWYPLKFVGFNSSISIDHKDVADATADANEFTSTLEDKLGFYGGMINNELAEYSRCLLQSSYSEHHYCDDLYQNIINDEIELGHYYSALSIPEIHYFNVLHNTLNTHLSFIKQTRLLTREAFSGGITEYQADLNLPSFATIKWNGYPYSIYSNRNAPNSKMYSLYFNNYTTEDRDDNEIASISTFYNYDSLIEYATQFDYQFKQRKFVFSMLPDPSRNKDPIIYAEIIGDTSPSNGSLISLNARAVNAPNIDVPSDIRTISDISIINGKIIKKFDENINYNFDLLQDDVTERLGDMNARVGAAEVNITSLTFELAECPHLSTTSRPIRDPYRGTLKLWREGAPTATDISMYSPNWSTGQATLGSRTDIITHSYGADPSSTAYVDFKITDLSPDPVNSATLRLSTTFYDEYPISDGYLQFIDCSGRTHLIANDKTTDAIRYVNESSKPTVEMPQPYIVCIGGGNDPDFKLELRNSVGDSLGFIRFEKS